MKSRFLLLTIFLFLAVKLPAQDTWQPVRRAGFEFSLTRILFTTESNGYIIGNHTELAQTTSGGESWELYDWTSTSFGELHGFIQDICFTHPDTGWIVGNDGIMLKTTNGGREWDLLQQEENDPNYNACHFTDKNIGVITGYGGVILRTTDGGTTWEKQDSGIDTILWDTFFIDSLNGWCAGDFGTVLATTDGGDTWERQSCPCSGQIKTITFTDPFNGWTGSTTKNLFYTTNGGKNWKKKSIHTDDDYIISEIYFQGSLNGWIIGGNGYKNSGAAVLRTVDGGETWDQIQVPALNHLSSISFRNPLEGYIAGLYGTLLKTIDGGITWSPAVPACSNHINTVFFTDDENGWAIGKATLIFTGDGGTTWEQIQGLSGNDIFFTDRNNGWFVHAGQGIYNTKDAGQTWQQQIFITGYYKLFFHDSSRGWALSSDPNGSNVLRTKDGGVSWKYIHRLQKPMYAVCFTDSINGWLCGQDGFIYHTPDGGITWHLKHRGEDSGDTIYDICFTGENTGWGVSLNGYVWNTANKGKNWTGRKLPDNADGTPQAIYFADDLHGWVAGLYGLLLHTNDGGKTWDGSFSKKFGYWWSDIFFTDINHGWVAGLYGAIDRWEGTVYVQQLPVLQQPSGFELLPAWPNPFSVSRGLSGTRLHYVLPEKATVKIDIFNIRGQRVRTLQPGSQIPGRYVVRWDGRDQFGNQPAAGIYIYHVTTGRNVAVGKVCLMR